jgi:hypothetical protein
MNEDMCLLLCPKPRECSFAAMLDRVVTCSPNAKRLPQVVRLDEVRLIRAIA